MVDEYAPGANVGNPAGFIKGSIDEGSGATAALASFREAGGEIRDQTWFRLYGEVNDALARQGGAASLDEYQLPEASDYATWSMGPGGEYATQVKVFFTDRDTGLVGTSEFTYKTSEPHTPAEAEAAAWSEYADTDNAGEYGQTIQGTMTTNVMLTQAWPG